MSNPVTVLKDIYNETVALDEDDTKRRVSVIESFVKDKVIVAMKKYELFNLLYSKVYHTGSFYDGLRCGTANEFDLNLILNVQNLDLKFEGKGVEPGFVEIDTGIIKPNLKPQAWTMVQWENFLGCLTETIPGTRLAFLSPAKVRQWIQGILSKIKVEQMTHPEIRSVKFRESGPAWNLTIIPRFCNNEIDVDLVPAFTFDIKELKNLPEVYSLLQWNRWLEGEFFVIPKQSKRDRNSSARTWRLDFHDIEKSIIASQGYSKNIIRLLKVFRDANLPLKELSSYSLKTVVMHCIRNNPQIIWIDQHQPQLFLLVLRMLEAKLSDVGGIPYIFHHQCDVLWNINAEERRKMWMWIKYAIESLDNSMDKPNGRSVWRNFFGLK